MTEHPEGFETKPAPLPSYEKHRAWAVALQRRWDNGEALSLTQLAYMREVLPREPELEPSDE